jgi:N-acyl amino acid synthase of PEP-CTERM/exosortase system
MNATVLANVEGESGYCSHAGSRHLDSILIDGFPTLLEQSYRLRYQVYCLGRRFLPAEQYPAGQEIDSFDRHSLHVGAVTHARELVGTARAIKPSEMGLPVFEYCRPFPHETEFHPANTRLVEIGRLVVDRRFLRRQRSEMSGLASASPSDRARASRGREQRRVGSDVLVTLLAAMYQETRRIGASHWVAAMEESLSSQLIALGLPFRAFGPPSNYYGMIVPYQMALEEFEMVVHSNRFPELDGLLASVRPKTFHAGKSR